MNIYSFLRSQEWNYNKVHLLQHLCMVVVFAKWLKYEKINFNSYHIFDKITSSSQFKYLNKCFIFFLYLGIINVVDIISPKIYYIFWYLIQLFVSILICNYLKQVKILCKHIRLYITLFHINLICMCKIVYRYMWNMNFSIAHIHNKIYIYVKIYYNLWDILTVITIYSIPK